VFVEKPKANVYTVMLVVSFVALLTGCLVLCGEMAEYDWDIKAAAAKVPPEPPDSAPPAVVPPAAAPAEAPPVVPTEAPPVTPPAAEAPPAATPPGAAPPATTPPM
jgi:hypothetical protein